jgi:hypothetical protein
MNSKFRFLFSRFGLVHFENKLDISIRIVNRKIDTECHIVKDDLPSDKLSLERFYHFI